MVKGKEEETILSLEEKDDPDMPKFNIPKNMSQITVNIGPIKLQDLHAQELHQMFKASHAFSITFEKKDLDGSKKEHVGYVRLPFEFKTSTYLICVYNKLKNLRISGRDMSVNFPQEFVKLVEAAKKHQDEARKKFLAKKDVVQVEEEAKKKSVYVNNIPPNTSEDALKNLFPDSANVIIPKNSEGTSYGLAILEFDSADAAMMCIETSDEMELNGYKLKFSLAGSSKNESPVKSSTESKETHSSSNKESRKGSDDKKSTQDDSRLKSSQSVRSSTSSTPSRKDSSTPRKSPAFGADTKSRYSDTQKSSKSTPTSQHSRTGGTTASSATTTTTTTSTSWAGKQELLPKSSTTSIQRAVGPRTAGANMGSGRMQQPGNVGVMKTHGITAQSMVPYGAGRGASAGRAIPTLNNRKTVPPSVGGLMINRMVTPNNSMMSPSGVMMQHQGATVASAAGMMSQPQGMMSQSQGMMTSQGQGMVSMAAIGMVSPGVMVQSTNQMMIPVGPGTSQAVGMMPQLLTGGSVTVPSLIARTQQIMAQTPPTGGRLFPGGPQTALRDSERDVHPIRVDHRDDWQRSPERQDDQSRHSSHERQRTATLRDDRHSPARSHRSSLHGNDRDRWSQPRSADDRHYRRENWRGSGKSRGTGRPRYERTPDRNQGLPFEKNHRSEDELAELKSQVEIMEETLNRVAGRGPFSPGFDDRHSFDGGRPNIRDRSPDLRDREPILHDDHEDFRDRERQEFRDRRGFDDRLSDISLPEYESANRERRRSFDERRFDFDQNRRSFTPELERDRLDDRDRFDERDRFDDWRDDRRVDFPEGQRDIIAGHLPHEMDLHYPLDHPIEFGPHGDKRPYYDEMEMDHGPPKRHEGDMDFDGMDNPHFDDRASARFGREEGSQSPRKGRAHRGGRPNNRRGGKRGQFRGGRGRGH